MQGLPNNPQVKENKENPLLEKQPTDVSDRFAKFYLEVFSIESMELAFNAGVNYTGKFYGMLWIQINCRAILLQILEHDTQQNR